MTHWTDYLEPDQPDGAYLSWKQVQPRVGISRTTAWRLQKAGDFPEPYVVSKGRVAYREREVEAWKASRGHRVTTARRDRVETVAAAAPDAQSGRLVAPPLQPAAPGRTPRPARSRPNRERPLNVSARAPTQIRFEF